MWFSRAIHCAPVAALLLFLLVLPTLTARGAAADDMEEAATQPGLLARYVSGPQPESASVEFTRFESVPTFLLAEKESPDPRLCPAGWQVNWEGLLRVAHPGKYRFAAVHSGPLTIEVAGKTVYFHAGAQKSPVAGEAIKLPFGPAALKIRFDAKTPGAVLKIFWESETIPQQPLESQVLAHAAKAPEPMDPFAAGRLAIGEHNCTRCHLPLPPAPICMKTTDQLTTRPGPRLTGAGKRLKAGWIFHWLKDPQALRPEAVMPRLFTSDRRGELERYAVAVYLASQVKSPPADEKPVTAAQLADGQRLYNQVGCVVCHAPHDKTPSRATLAALGRKTTVAALAEYLRNPAAIDPAGRMPSMRLTAPEAESLAAYLIGRDAAQAPREVLPEGLSDVDGGTLATIARRVLQEKRCVNCHDFTPAGEKSPLASTPAKSDFSEMMLSAAAHPDSGCLAQPAECNGQIPVFGASLDRAAAAAFVRAAPLITGTPAPGAAAQLALQRYNCLGCHRRNAEGGLATDVVALLAQNQTPETAELVNPPPLTGVVEKLRADALLGVLVKGRLSRPWMTLRMPEFPKEAVAPLPAGLAALDGDHLNSDPPEKGYDKKLAKAGRQLVGSQGFGCTKCHDMLGVASTGTRGPDLASVAERVNHSWYSRWMIDPQQLQPGTRMPTVFLNGTSPFPKSLGGDPVKQRLAIWEYLAHASEFPPPLGLNESKTADVLVGSGSYQTLRSFMPETTARSMAIRYANGVHLCYDLQACRLAYAWSGEFLNLNPVWEGRGGQPAGIKGTVFWHSPAGFPWDVTLSPNTVPDFSTHGADTALGAALPHDGKLHPTRLDFRGYQLTESGPTFRYELHLDGEQTATFHEQVVSLSAPAPGAGAAAEANGVLRVAEVSAPADRILWLQAALAEQPPRWIAGGGASGQLDAPDKSAPAEAAIRCMQDGKPVVLHLRSAPAGAAWTVAKAGNQYALLLRFAAAGATSPVRLSLAILSPTGDPAATQAAELPAK